MEVEINKSEVVEKVTFPLLAEYKSGGVIVLFTSDKIGTVLKADKDHTLGEYREDWILSQFRLFKGDITLRND